MNNVFINQILNKVVWYINMFRSITVYKTSTKINSPNDGRKRARLVAKGFQAEHTEEDFNYAPVARLSTIRMLACVALQWNLPIRQLDVPTAFLHGDLQNSVYIKKPEGVTHVRGQFFFFFKRNFYIMTDILNVQCCM